jgi:hypothetical protein
VTVGINVHFYGESPVGAREIEEDLTNRSHVLLIMFVNK